jgi:hypothetical protein
MPIMFLSIYHKMMLMDTMSEKKVVIANLDKELVDRMRTYENVDRRL